MEVDTQEEMPFNEEMGNEEVIESGQEEESYEDESQVDTSSDEESDDQESDTIDYKKLYEEESEAKARAEEYQRAIQSEADKKIHELQKKFEEFVENTELQLKQQQDPSGYDDDEPLTRSQLLEELKKEETRKALAAQKKLTQREKQEKERSEANARWLQSRADYQEVDRFYKANNLANDPEFQQVSETQGQFYFAKMKQLASQQKEAENKAYKRGLRDAKKKKVPSTGNPGTHFGNSFKESSNKMMNAFNSYHENLNKKRGLL
jgi:hypothetical protein